MTMAPAAMKQTNSENLKKNRIQVSNTKKPLFFCLLQSYHTVVTIAEILKNNGFVKEKSITTSTVGMKDQAKGRVVHKARIEIVLEKSEKFDSLVNANHAAQNATANNAKVVGNGKVEANGNVENSK
ncbi:hypothetical protein Sango_2962900 [Sesamum angolense]|uniref:Alba DNA/RNA-binding protein n=1 Tax=Sesamum angolense TaxID=2727404 RepID=A0AAE1VXW4_9LAMI|nr:hypothetical protein Sango_2962900 [Sesamum angolense]